MHYKHQKFEQKNKAISKSLSFSEHTDLLINKAAFILTELNRESDLLIMCWGNGWNHGVYSV